MAVKFKRFGHLPPSGVQYVVFKLVQAWGPQGLDPKAIPAINLILNPASEAEAYTGAVVKVLGCSQKVKGKVARLCRQLLEEYVRAKLEA